MHFSTPENTLAVHRLGGVPPWPIPGSGVRIADELLAMLLKQAEHACAEAGLFLYGLAVQHTYCMCSWNSTGSQQPHGCVVSQCKYLEMLYFRFCGQHCLPDDVQHAQPPAQWEKRPFTLMPLAQGSFS